LTTPDDKLSDYEADCLRRKEALDAIEDRLFEIAVQLAVVKYDVHRTMTNYRAEIAAIDAARARRLEAETHQDASRA
jgi:hypothetical protein